MPQMLNGQFQTNIQIVKPDGSAFRTLTASGTPLLGNLTWATNDDALIATGHVGGLSSPMQLLLIDASDGSVEPCDAARAREPAAVSATLSPDGRALFFTRGFDSPAKLLRVPIDGGPVTPLLEVPMIYDHAVSPDGAEIAVISNTVRLPTPWCFYSRAS